MGLQIGILNVRRSAFIRAAPARVWQEFTTAERIRAWLGRGHVLEDIEPVPGGSVRFSVDIEGVVHRFGGTVIDVSEGAEMSFAINWDDPDMAGSADTFWTFRLTACYAGTLAELFHHGFERLGEAAADEFIDYEWGWDVKHLAALKDIVEG